VKFPIGAPRSPGSRSRTIVAVPDGTPPYAASAIEPAIAACVSAFPPGEIAGRTASSNPVDSRKATIASGSDSYPGRISFTLRARS
jgi:hypothetical protein